MSAIDSIETIVSNGLCIGCGLCVAVAGEDTLEMKLTSYGQLRPTVKRTVSRSVFTTIKAVCPGVTVSGPSRSTAGRDGTFHPVWGPVRTVHRGWAGDKDVRFHAAAGGALSALGAYLLNSGKVDAVLHVQASSENPLLTDAKISRRAADVHNGAQSRYGPAAPLVHVNDLLDEGIRFAVIGKPCDIAAVRNLARVDARVESQVPYCLTIFCGGVPTYHTAEKIVRYHGVEPEQVAVFRFRGDGWPGPTRVQTKDGSVFDVSYDQAWYDDSVPWRYDIQFRCKICPDAIGELADVACPDGWVLENGKSVHKEAPGVNLFVARTARGEELVSEAAEAGAVELSAVEVDILDVMHPDHYPRKLENPARIVALRLAGSPAPRFQNFRRCWTLLNAGVMRQLRAFCGTWRRVRAGANREPLS